MVTWIVGTVVVVIVGLAVYKVYKDRKDGKGCSCACGECPSDCRRPRGGD